MFFVLFGLGVFLILHFLEYPKILIAVIGGDALGLLVIIKGLQQFWRESTAIGILITTIPNLSPDEVLKVVESIFYGAKSNSD